MYKLSFMVSRQLPSVEWLGTILLQANLYVVYGTTASVAAYEAYEAMEGLNG
jgi:hypothetical protein